MVIRPGARLMRGSICGLAVLFLGVSGAWAGNREMMDRAGAELVQINNQLLQELGADRRDGEYHILARIVERDGKKVIAIDRLERHDREGGDSLLPPGAGSGTYIQYGPIPQSEVFPAASSVAVPTGGAAALDRVGTLLEAHPGAQLMELDAAAVRQLPLKDPSPSGGGALLIYW
jgi:hypothetical protein